MRIGGRLLILLALPLAGLLAVTSFGVYSGAEQSSAASGLKTRTDLAMSAFDLANELQLQRASLVRGEKVSDESMARVNADRERISANLSSLDAATQRLAETTMRRVDGAIGVAHTSLGGGAAISSLSPAIDSVLELATDAIDPGGEVDAAWASTADNLARAQAASSEEADRLVLLEDVPKLDPTDFQTLVGLASSQRSLLALAATSAPYEMGVRIDRVGHGVVAADEYRQAALADLSGMDLKPWITGVESRTDDVRGLHDEAATEAVRVVDNLAASSRRLLLLAAAAALVTLLITILLLRRAIRSIAKPLASLAAQAEDVARVRLPEAVKAQQDDPDSQRELPALQAEGAAEVHEVAAAFNDIQNTALRLASEQAALRVNQAEALTNLGRRNQTLLVRQLDYITSLETEETDPEFLEHLFKLDHLASRMRRNAESLLILAGSETPRRRRSPAQVTEVVRAAMSEVEDFERVRIAHLVDSALAGPVVIDLIHLLAELVENALGFSPPDTTVEIDGGPLSQGGYQFAVIDHGVGMTDVELTAANHRLAGLDEFDGMPTRYLGQYVVAKLAAKIGVLVRLHPTNGGRGVSAIITLPATAMFGAPDRAASTRPRPGSRAAREQGPEPFAPGSAVPHIDVDGAEQEPVAVPDLRDEAHIAADDLVVRDPDAAQLVDNTEDEDSHPERWDRVVDSVLGNVVDLSGIESAAPVNGGVTSSEVAEVFGADSSDETAKWWTAPEPSTEVRAEADQPETASAEAALNETAQFETALSETEPVVDSPQVTPPAFSPQVEAPFQEWRMEPASSKAAPTEPASTEPALVEPAAEAESFEVSAVQPVPTKPPPNASPGTPGEWPQQPIVVEDPDQTTQGQSDGLASGLLRRRVPGASLASRSSGFADAPAKPVERSADDVRSRLASFQAGRNRGRTIPEAGAESAGVLQSETINGSADEVTGDQEVSQDWRSGK